MVIKQLTQLVVCVLMFSLETAARLYVVKGEIESK